MLQGTRRVTHRAMRLEKPPDKKETMQTAANHPHTSIVWRRQQAGSALPESEASYLGYARSLLLMKL